MFFRLNHQFCSIRSIFILKRNLNRIALLFFIIFYCFKHISTFVDFRRLGKFHSTRLRSELSRRKSKSCPTLIKILYYNFLNKFKKLILSNHVGSCAQKATDQTAFYCGTGSNCNDLSKLTYNVGLPSFLTLSGPCNSTIDPNIEFQNITNTVY